MKPFIVIGILLLLAGTSVNMQLPGAGSWMLQAGLIFLFDALAVSRKEKIWMQSCLLFMVALFLWGFVNGMWYAHPLGAILSIAAGGWVAYRLIKDKQNEAVGTFVFDSSKFPPKLLLNVKQHIKWVSVPLGILIALALTKSILIAFIVGFGFVAFLDKQSIKVKGLNRVAILLLLYIVGFSILLITTFKYEYRFSNYNDLIFFSDDTFYFLEDVTRGL